jgi:replicative DNA helicase
MSGSDDGFRRPADAVDREVAALRLPPHSIEAEQSVLGGLLLDSQAFDRVGDLLREEDFYRLDHRLIWQQIARLVERGQPADVITVLEALKNAGKADEAGGLGYLNALAQETPSAANIRRYAEIVRDRAILRQLIGTADEIATQALNPQGRDTRQILDEAESRIFQISEDGARGAAGFQNLQDLLGKVVSRVDELYSRGAGSDVTGVPTGFADLDRMTSGLQPGDLVIVAGRPSMGKAQPDDEPVLGANGWQPMGSLRVGDALASPDGLPSRITGIFPQGRRPVWRLRFSDGRSTRACDEHLWRVAGRDGVARVLDTATLRSLLARRGARPALAIDLPEGRFGHRDPLPLDPFGLGLLLRPALGCGRGTQAARGFVVDRARVAAIDPALPRRALLRTATESHAAAATATATAAATAGVAAACAWPDASDVSSTPDVSDVSDASNSARSPAGVAVALRRLEALGLLGADATRLFLPRAMLQADRPARVALLCGLLGPLAVADTRALLRVRVESARLATDLCELVRSLGGWCRPRQVPGVGLWSLALMLPSLPGLAALRSPPTDGRAGRPIRRPVLLAIEAAGEAETRCIAVSHPSRLYVAGEHVLTHNTAFSLNIGEHVAVDQGLPVAVFSMEMGATQLALRMVCSVGRLDQQRLRTGRLVDDDWPRLTNAIQKMQEAQLFIDESPALNALELRARARRLSRQCGQLGLIIVDYLQLMSSAGSGENRATEISEISRGLKGLAKELNCPVIALSQLNRSLEQRPNKRPVMSDLRESGAIEQDADVILFIYRDEVYNPDSADKGSAEIIIGKQRNGPIGSVRLTFVGQYTKFENYAAGAG